MTWFYPPSDHGRHGDALLLSCPEIRPLGVTSRNPAGHTLRKLLKWSLASHVDGHISDLKSCLELREASYEAKPFIYFTYNLNLLISSAGEIPTLQSLQVVKSPFISG